ncbi:HlyD family efflux transporter periplasmic adaptor subunit [Chitinophaga polysaccharea]|uniref:HlyD family efflux transporter periplasmic adaptor subunit n=1 Tax=Chitinophaga polysaccharea TaxID=1293035 RepID=UPI001455BD92|nr:HlyD family secretion protein [Chitinophaga polysaccharea]NLR62642.1 HlyD family efflux transporter periplasmic adaptor subunit [Chitinophaga polysaccharea]
MMIDEVVNNYKEASPSAEILEMVYSIQQRSEMVQEIISHKPGFLERWALYLFLIILLSLFSTTWFIKYPDIIEANAVLTATNAPKEIIVRQEGRLVNLLTFNRKKVKKNELLGLMESNASHQEVLELSMQIDSCITLFNHGRFEKVVRYFSRHHNNLGEIQQPYGDFIKSLQQFDDYVVNGFYARKTETLRQDATSMDQAKLTLQQQLELTEQDVKLAEESYNMNKELFDGKVIAKEEFRNEKSKFVNKKMSIPQLTASLISNESQKRDKLKEIDQLQHDYLQQKVLFQQAIQSLKNVVDEWKRKYVIMAPIAGEVVLNVPLQENQFLLQGKTLGYIDPGFSQYFAEISLPQTNLGKIDTGLQVQLRFAAYPYQEVGFVKGTINYVSKIASDSGFMATVRLDNGLVTNNHGSIT